MNSAIVLVIDGLSARFLGPYANTWFGTDQFDRLAAQSLMAEFAFSDSTDLAGGYRSLLGMRPAFHPLAEQGNDAALLKSIAEQDVRSTLFTDSVSLPQFECVKGFDQVVESEFAATGKVADSAGETELAAFFAEALAHVDRIQDGELLWLHSKGLAEGNWDAPYSMRCEFADEEDPDPPTFVSPPAEAFEIADADPDVQLGYQQACAAQVGLINQFLGLLLDRLEMIEPASRPMFILTSSRGFPLGTRGIVGQPESSLYDDALHVPFFLSWPPGGVQLQRPQSLIYPGELGQMLLSLFSDSELPRFCQNPLPVVEEELLVSANATQICLRTQAWKFIREGDDFQLFVKPDDRWDTNDVANKCRGVCEDFDVIASEIESEIKAAGQPAKRALDEALVENLN